MELVSGDGRELSASQLSVLNSSTSGTVYRVLHGDLIFASEEYAFRSELSSSFIIAAITSILSLYCCDTRVRAHVLWLCMATCFLLSMTTFQHRIKTSPVSEEESSYLSEENFASQPVNNT
jgi:hypothetical protein